MSSQTQSAVELSAKQEEFAQQEGKRHRVCRNAHSGCKSSDLAGSLSPSAVANFTQQQIDDMGWLSARVGQGQCTRHHDDPSRPACVFSVLGSAAFSMFVMAFH